MRRSRKKQPKKKKLNGQLTSSSFRSGFEGKIAYCLALTDRYFEYEPIKVPYTLSKTYVPDFRLANGVLVEAKGQLRREDIAKLKAVREQHPQLDIRLLFQNAKNKIRKGSKTTYGQWATKNGFKWAEGPQIPDEWF